MAGIERFGSGGPWEAGFGYSRAVRAGDLLLVAGTTAIDEDGVVRGVGDAGAQAAFALDRIERRTFGSVRPVPHTAPFVLVATASS